MDRKSLKEKAKEKIKGNLWYLWKPQVYFALILFVLGLIIGLPLAIAKVDEQTTSSIISSITGILGGLFEFGYAKYCLDFARGKKDDWKEPFNFAKTHIFEIIAISILTALAVFAGTILLIIPGIIIALGLSYVQEVYIDNTKLSAVEALKHSWKITNGHKMDLFVLGLSFIGWSILGAFTFGILYIWLIPYMEVTLLLAYEKFRK